MKSSRIYHPSISCYWTRLVFNIELWSVWYDWCSVKCWKDLKYLVIIYFFIYKFLVYKIHLQKNHKLHSKTPIHSNLESSRLHSNLESSRLHSNLESRRLHSTTPLHLLAHALQTTLLKEIYWSIVSVS